VLAELLSERDYKMPYFVGFGTVDQACEGQLANRLFALSARESLKVPSKKLDLITLKLLILRSYQLCQFELREIQQTMRWNQDKYLISRKYFEIYQMVGNISIDGFKRERYVVKVKDISDELVRAYRGLNEEEQKIETSYTVNRMEASAVKTSQYSINEHKNSYSTEKEY
jgi:hypothetical protein